MKRRRKRTRLTDLNSDVLKRVLSYVISSSGGAVHFARIRCVCKEFKESADVEDLLRCTNFYNLEVPIGSESFWMRKGLFSRCACAGNFTCVLLLLKNLKDRIKSMKRLAVPSLNRDISEMMGRGGRYFTRAKIRSMKPFMNVKHQLEIDNREVVEIIDMLLRIKSSFDLKEAQFVEGLECYKEEIIESIDVLNECANSMLEIILEVTNSYDSIVEPLMKALCE